MTNKEFHRLSAYVYAHQNRMRPTNMPPSRRQSKSKGTATGQILKTSRVQYQTGLSNDSRHRPMERGNIITAMEMFYKTK